MTYRYCPKDLMSRHVDCAPPDARAPHGIAGVLEAVDIRRPRRPNHRVLQAVTVDEAPAVVAALPAREGDVGQQLHVEVALGEDLCESQ